MSPGPSSGVQQLLPGRCKSREINQEVFTAFSLVNSGVELETDKVFDRREVHLEPSEGEYPYSVL